MIKNITITIIIVLTVIFFSIYFSTLDTTNTNASTQVQNAPIKNKTDDTVVTGTTNTNIQNNMQENTIDTEVIKATSAKITTSMGDIEIEFTPDTAPNTVANFIKLASQKFYDNVKFHRVIQGFMVQVGDPLSKDDSKQAYWGTGGPGYKFDDELSGKETYKRGTVAMANSGPNTNGSQFFIVTAEDSQLPPLYTVFGKVTAGMDVALKIESVQTNSSDRPLVPVIISSITLIK